MFTNNFMLIDNLKATKNKKYLALLEYKKLLKKPCLNYTEILDRDKKIDCIMANYPEIFINQGIFKSI